MIQEINTMEIKDILEKHRVVAVVGLSPNPERPSHRVARYLQSAGYRIVPVHPAAKEILGEKTYPTLQHIPFPVDIVDVFRKAEDVPPIARQAVEVKAKVLWLQEGIVSDEAAEACRAAGLEVVMDKCMLKEHRRCLCL